MSAVELKAVLISLSIFFCISGDFPTKIFRAATLLTIIYRNVTYLPQSYRLIIFVVLYILEN